VAVIAKVLISCAAAGAPGAVLEYTFSSTPSNSTNSYVYAQGHNSSDDFWSIDFDTNLLNSVPRAGLATADWNALSNGATTVAGTFTYDTATEPVYDVGDEAYYDVQFEPHSVPTVSAFDALWEEPGWPATISVANYAFYDALFVGRSKSEDASSAEVAFDLLNYVSGFGDPEYPALESLPVRAQRYVIDAGVSMWLQDSTSTVWTNTSLPLEMDLADFNYTEVHYWEVDYWDIYVDPADYANAADHLMVEEWLENAQVELYRQRDIYFPVASLLLASEPTLPGDFNGDQVVDAADHVVWSKFFGSGFSLSGNGDEQDASAAVVDYADYGLWTSRFGTSGGGGGGGATAPEPGLLCCSAAAVGLVITARAPRSAKFVRPRG
jgi:hypothetical protein